MGFFAKFKERISQRWPKLLSGMGALLIFISAYELKLALKSWMFFPILFLFYIYQALRFPRKELAAMPQDKVIVYHHAYDFHPFFWVISGLISVALVVTVALIQRNALNIALVTTGILLCLGSMWIESKRGREIKAWEIEPEHYHRIEQMVDPSLSESANARRILAHTWGDRRQTKAITRAVLGRMAVRHPIRDAVNPA